MSDTLLDRILSPGGITAYFQPVVEIRPELRRILCVECLTRGPKDTLFENAGLLFSYVQRKRAEPAVDRACIAAGLLEFAHSPIGTRLCVNVHASTLGRDPEFPAFLQSAAQACSIAMPRLTVEIVEHTPAWHVPQFLRSLQALRQAGATIALDDIGIGYSNYRMMLDVHPDCFKVDSYFVRGCHQDASRRAILGSIFKLAQDFSSAVIAEGVETTAELRALLDLDFHLFQGFLFSRAVPIRDIPNTNLWDLDIPDWAAAPTQCAALRV